jgi:protein-tyrosine phosphatase
MTVKVLFVCSGNICRSPMAEAVFQDKVNKAGLSDFITADSVGTGSWHVGEHAHRGTLTVLRKHGIPYNGRARQLTRADLQTFDYVLAMDADNLRAISRLARESRAEIALFLSYAHTSGMCQQTQVPDPYYDDRFDLVYDLVTTGADALLAHIRARHQL